MGNGPHHHIDHSPKMDTNTVFLKSMPFTLPVGLDAWHRDNKPQPVLITLQVKNVTSIADAAATDDISKSLDYGKLYKTICRNLEDQKYYANLREVMELVAFAIPSVSVLALVAEVEVVLSKASLRAEGGFVYTFEQNPDRNSLKQYEKLEIRGIKCACIIGVNPHERREKQVVVVDLTFRGDSKEASTRSTEGRRIGEVAASVIAVEKPHQIVDTVVKVRCQTTLALWTPSATPSLFNPADCISTWGLTVHEQRVEGSSYHTIEALASAICKDLTMEWNIPEVEVSIEKPYAIPSIGAAGVRIRRRRSFYASSDFWQAR
jgi:dihydroneopterin aldolase